MNETTEVYPKQYEAILKATHVIGFPQLSELPIGSFLATLAASKQSGHLLELGTGTDFARHGYCMECRRIRT
ncbi:hypothetical protein [Vibrio sp. 10N.247.310.17]|uniref:hypothetical protein n=1 Tax=Vibrio sp. 10N.247.310.17 TaxID=3229979 RepID=UPI00354D13EE